MTTTITSEPVAGSARPISVFVLANGEAPGSGFVRIVLEQLDAASWHLDRMSDADHHIHEVRKATKRVRAVLRMIRDEIGEDVYRDVNREVRDVARQLSQARSSVVQVELLEALVVGDESFEMAAGTLREDLLVEAAASMAALKDNVIADLESRLRSVSARIETLEGTLSGTTIRAGVQRTYHRGRRAMHLAYDHASAEDFHVWRKQVKYLRHQMEVLAHIGTSTIGDLAAELEGIGEALGADNDLADLARSASAGEPWAGRSELLQLITTNRVDLEQALRDRAANVYGQQPALFGDRIAQALR